MVAKTRQSPDMAATSATVLRFLHRFWTNPRCGVGAERWRFIAAGTGLLSLFLTAPSRAGEAIGWQKLTSLPNRTGVAAPFAGVSGGVLFAGGGANFPDKMPWEGGKKVWHDAIWVLEMPDGVWRGAGRLPRPLAYGVGLSVNGLILCIGGSDAERHYAEVLAYEWRDGKLVDSAVNPGPLPVPLANAAGAVDDNQTVYIGCGSLEPGERSASNRVFCARFHGEAPEWRELPVLPAEPRILPVAAAQGDAFYLFGGAALEMKDGKAVRRYLRDAWRFTAAAGWKRVEDMPNACAAAASPAPVSGGGIFVAGGDDGTLAGTDPQKHPGFSGRLLRYDVAANSWTRAGEVPAPRATVPCVPWNGRFILPSGEVRPGVRSPDVWEMSVTPSAK